MRAADAMEQGNDRQGNGKDAILWIIPLPSTRSAAFYGSGLIQRHAAPDIRRHIEVFAFVDRGLAFVEAALGNDFERQRALAHLGGIFARARLPGHELFHLLGRQRRRRRHEA